jgi:DNA primase small subunit
METLSRYHRRLFPIQAVYAWATRHSALGFREWAFHVFRRETNHSSSSADGIATNGERQVWRNQCFSSAEALQSLLEHYVVERIELGPLLNVEPRMERLYKVGAYALAKELVMDVDASDYERPALCLETHHERFVCARCWPLVACAAECLDYVLRKQLGFKHVLWLYSGGRGAHAWVCDERALTMMPTARLLVENTLIALRKSVAGERPATRGERPLLSILQRYSTSYEYTMPTLVPRIDSAVTAQLTHLLRAPFSAHPGSGSLALPMPLSELCSTETPQKAPKCEALLRGDPEALAMFNRSLQWFSEFCNKL